MNLIEMEVILKKAQLLLDLNKAAQAVLDVERPGETVQEVLINTNSAKSLKELLTPATPPESKPKKTVYDIKYFSMSEEIQDEPLLPRQHRFESLEYAIKELERLKKTYSIGYRFFLVKSEVDA